MGARSGNCLCGPGATAGCSGRQARTPAGAPDRGRSSATRPVPAAQLTIDKQRMSAWAQDLCVGRVRTTQAQRIGDGGEQVAVSRLEALGWRILARNVRVGRAEVDVLAVDPSDPPMLVLVEVRVRGRRDFGLAEETIGRRKRTILRRAAGELMARRVLPDGMALPSLPVRIDVIAIDRGPDGRAALRHHRGLEG